MNHFEEIQNFPERIAITELSPEETYSYEGVSQLWGGQVTVDISLDEDETALAEYLPLLEKHLAWLNAHRKEAVQALLDDDFLELAEDWASSAEPAEDEEQECYLMEDGQKVFFPITEEDFSCSLHLSSVVFDCEDGKDQISAELWCECSPDYFAYHSVLIYVNADGSMESGSLQG